MLSAASGLSSREQMRLAGILARLASPFDGERAAAALLANAFMHRHGLAWSDLTVFRRTVSEQQPSPEARPPYDRRHLPGRPWQGYCRRRPLRSAQALNCIA